MGRTQATYRRRLQNIRDRLLRLSPVDKSKYRDLWEVAHQLSAPSSTLPYPDTHAIASFCMILEGLARLSELKTELDDD